MKVPSENSDLFERIDYGVKKAIRNAILEHKEQGRSIYISKDGKVVEIPPAEIEVPPLTSVISK